jgi:hypothetical protein
MTCRYGALVSIAVLAAGTPNVARAQEPALAQASTQPAQTAAPATPVAQTPVERRVDVRVDKTRMMPQGFSVVLVLADIQAASGPDDVPPAARKALADMKDFLPYKSYKLLDAAWMLCCGPGSGEVTSRMKGPEDQDYELRLSASQSREQQNLDSARVYVRFSLRELNEATPDVAALAQALTAEQQREVEKLRDQIAQLEIALAGLKAAQPVTPERRDERKRLEAQIDYLKQRLTTQEGRSPRRSTRSMMDTNFLMDVGETVVVGTSRLKGGSKALIAMLTAVPPRGERKEKN